MKFEKVYIELTDYCALACGFCPSAAREEARGQMSLELFSRICEQLEGRAVRVCLHILGDPLSVRNLSDYAKILAAHKLCAELVSTGLFLRRAHFELLLTLPFVQVAFSLSAHLANPQSFTRAHLLRILDFAQTNIARGSPIFINLRIHSRDVPRALELLSPIAQSFGLAREELLRPLARGERVRLGSKVFLNPTRSFEWRTQQSRKQVRCYGANKQIGILSNGALVPCCMDYLGRASFGNLASTPLQELLDSQSFLSFARALREGGAPPSPLCAQCGFVSGLRED